MNGYENNLKRLREQFALVSNLIPHKDFDVCVADPARFRLIDKILEDATMSEDLRALIETERDFIQHNEDQCYIIQYHDPCIIMMDPKAEVIPCWRNVHTLQLNANNGIYLQECAVRVIPLYVYDVDSNRIGAKYAEIPFEHKIEIHHRYLPDYGGKWYRMIDSILDKGSAFFIDGALYKYVSSTICKHPNAKFIRGNNGNYSYVLGSYEVKPVDENTTDTEPENDTNKPQRISKHEYGLQLAEAVAKRGTCLRRKFGAVIIKDDIVVSTGYVGAPRGRINCCDRGTCFRNDMNIKPGERYELCRSVHAEMNAVINASREEMKDATLYLVGIENDGSYTEAAPCAMCKRVIINAGIKQVVARTPLGYKIFDVHNWIADDDSLTINEGY